jgi:ABC-type oligopeptide transport system ATPase subunit
MAEQKEPLLVVNHLKKYFNTKKGKLHAVDDVSFSIEAGKTLGVVGESGCGKSTLGKTILRLTEPTSGEVFLTGRMSLRIMRRNIVRHALKCMMIFQDRIRVLIRA